MAGSEYKSEDTEYDECEGGEERLEKSVPHQLPNEDWIIPFSVAMVIKKVEDRYIDGVCDQMSKKVTATMIFRFKCTGLKNK